MKTLGSIIACLVLAPLALAQNQNVTQQIATKRVNSDIAIGSGRTITIESGGTLTANSGATINIAGIAPSDATYITQTTSSGLSAEQALSSLSTGLLQVTTATGVLSSVTTSAGIAGLLSDETGSGALVFGTSPAFTTNFTFANSSSPTTSSVAQTAFDTDAWASGRGAVQLYDGTAATYLVGVLASDTPSDGQVPRWNTGGTITWETPSGGGGGGTFPGSSTDNALVRFDGTGGSTVQNSNVTLADSGTALVFSGAAGLTATGTSVDVSLSPGSSGKTNITRALWVNGTGINDVLYFKGGPGGSGSTAGVAFDATDTSFGGHVSTRINFVDDGDYGAHVVLSYRTGGAGTTTTDKIKFSSSGNLTFLISGRGILGTTTNDAADSGVVGQLVSSYVATGSAVSLTTATSTDVTSISLTAGDWDVEANININYGSATTTAFSGAIHTTSATLPTDGSEVYSGLQLTTTTAVESVAVPRKRISLSSTTTVYLVARPTFSAGTAAAFGGITARRVR